jgi:2-haloacid dehalogenase
MPFSEPPKALFFDVFGTCVDWRTTVTNELLSQSAVALHSTADHIPASVVTKASGMIADDWGRFAQGWRNSYKSFVWSLAADPTLPWKTVDEHHLHSLKTLLGDWGIAGLWTEGQLAELSLVWHQLAPWPDSAAGIQALNAISSTSTLSNGNLELLHDLNKHGDMAFKHVLSGEQFGSYKPSPKVYLGAVDSLGLEPGQCAMVAAHLGDLKAARSCGLRTIYVERPLEEDWMRSEIEKARAEGWVDLWVPQGSQGFITVAEKLGSWR